MAVISALVAGGVFVFLLFAVKWSIVIDMLIAVGVYAGLYMATKPRRKIGNINIDFLNDGEELEQKLEEAKEDYERIKRSAGKIIDLQIRETAEKLCSTSEKIIAYLENNPLKIHQATERC